MTAMSLAKAIENCEIRHPAYAQVHAAMVNRINSALAGRASVVEWVVGPSRAGKSMLWRALQRQFPETKGDDRRQVHVLGVPVLPGVSPKELAAAPLEPLLGLRNVKGSVSSITAMTRRQLVLARVVVVLWEEVSHVVDVGAKVASRAAGDVFKDWMDNAHVTHIFFGLPKLEKLMQRNEQLRLRAKKRWEFRPYNWMVESQRDDFAACVQTSSRCSRKQAIPSTLSSSA